MRTDDVVAEFRTLAHDMGLTHAQAKRLTAWWRGRLENVMAAHDGARRKTDAKTDRSGAT